MLTETELRPVVYGEPLKHSLERYCTGHVVKVPATHGLRYTRRDGDSKKWMLLPVCEACLPIKFNALCDTPGVHGVSAAVLIYHR